MDLMRSASTVRSMAGQPGVALWEKLTLKVRHIRAIAIDPNASNSQFSTAVYVANGCDRFADCGAQMIAV